MSPVILTIGHSNHALERFLAMLEAHAVERVVDVRSVPWSRRWPWFRKPELAAAVRSCGREYLHLGQALGGRPGRGRQVAPAAFAAAVEQVVAMAGRWRVVLMCAEADPARCHRASLLAPAFVQRGVRVVHLLDERRAEEHAHTAARMAPAAPPVGDLFGP